MNTFCTMVGALVLSSGSVLGQVGVGDGVLKGGEVNNGVVNPMGSGFHYQGTLSFDGVPANGDFFFEIRIVDSDGDELDPRYAEVGPVTVTDGLFEMEILMGGTETDGDFFWKNYGGQEKFLRLRVSDVDDGSYTTLSPDVPMSSTPHALWSRYADRIQFPYSDSDVNYLSLGSGQPMISLERTNGREVIDIELGATANGSPAVFVRGTELFNTGNFSARGVLEVNALDRDFGVLGISNQFPVLGVLETERTINNAAILGQVENGSDDSSIAVWALNQNSGSNAALGTKDYSGDFNRDVIVRRDLRVRGEAVRDFSINNPAPIGPLAYGSISTVGNVTAGTGNLSASWNDALSRYEISVTNETMTFGTHVAVVTVVDTSRPRVATVNNGNGDFFVKIWDIRNDEAVQDNFQIVIYDPDTDVTARVAIPEGVDVDKMMENGSGPLIQTAPRHEPVEPFESYGNGVTGN